MRTIIFSLLLFLCAVISKAQVYNESLTLTSQTEIDNFNYTQVKGNLTIEEAITGNITNLDGLSSLTSVGWSFLITANNALTDIHGLSGLTFVGDDLQFYNNAALTNLDGLSQLTSVLGTLSIYQNQSLTSIDGLSSLTSVGWSFLITANSALTDIHGLSGLTAVGRDLVLYNNAALTSLDGLSQLTSVEGTLSIYQNQSLTSIDGLSSLTSIGSNPFTAYGLYIVNNQSLTNVDALSNLTFVGGGPSLIMNNVALIDFCGLYNVLQIGGVTNSIIINNNGLNPSVAEILADGPCPLVYDGSIHLNNQYQIDNFNYSHVTGDVNIYDFHYGYITNLDGLSELNSIGGHLFIHITSALPNIDGLSNLSAVGGSILIYDNLSLTNVDGLTSLQNVGSSISIYDNGALTNINSLSSLQSFEGSISLTNNSSLVEINGLSNLNYIAGNLTIGANTNLNNINGFGNLTSVGGNLGIANSPNLTDINGFSNLTNVNGIFSLAYNPSLISINGFSNLTTVGQQLRIIDNETLSNIDALSSLTAIGTDLVVYVNPSLSNVNGLSNIASVGGDIWIHGNSILTEFCGIYNLLNVDGVAGDINIYDNNYNPTPEQIILAGPCGNHPPIASAGDDQSIIVGETVQLDGSLSSDPDGDPLTFIWQITATPNGSSTTLSDVSLVNPIFIADYAGIYSITLIVNDGLVNSPSVHVTVTALTEEEAFETQISMVETLPVNNGIKNALTTKIDQALIKYNAGKINVAINLLNALINQLNDLVVDNVLTSEEAQPLIEYTQSLISVLTNGLLKQVYGDNNSINVPDEYKLIQNYPNPFNPVTNIKFQIVNPGLVILKIYDILGKEVADIVDEELEAGYYIFQWDASELSSGVYFYRITAGNYTEVKKMLLMK